MVKLFIILLTGLVYDYLNLIFTDTTGVVAGNVWLPSCNL